MIQVSTMSGHSHWSSIKHKKGAEDAKRGKLFSKLSHLIAVAAKEGGGDPEANPRLRLVIEQAKQANVPKDNIERAIKRGTGQLEGVTLKEVTYEAYGPNGVALIIEGITDNKNRTLSEIKSILSRLGGKLAETGSVKYMFNKEQDKWTPKYPMELQEEKAKGQIDKLLQALRENDDVQRINSNLK